MDMLFLHIGIRRIRSPSAKILKKQRVMDSHNGIAAKIHSPIKLYCFIACPSMRAAAPSMPK
jgi:hypothetical protein